MSMASRRVLANRSEASSLALRTAEGLRLLPAANRRSDV
jgi:hypothetical protein